MPIILFLNNELLKGFGTPDERRIDIGCILSGGSAGSWFSSVRKESVSNKVLSVCECKLIIENNKLTNSMNVFFLNPKLKAYENVTIPMYINTKHHALYVVLITTVLTPIKLLLLNLIFG